MPTRGIVDKGEKRTRQNVNVHGSYVLHAPKERRPIRWYARKRKQERVTLLNMLKHIICIYECFLYHNFCEGKKIQYEFALRLPREEGRIEEFCSSENNSILQMTPLGVD